MSHFVYVRKQEPEIESQAGKSGAYNSDFRGALIFVCMPMLIMLGIVALTTVLSLPFAWMLGLV